MADISELLIEVKNVDKTVNDIDRVGKKLKQTQQQALSLSKGLFAGLSFTALIASMKKFGDAFKDLLVTEKAFSSSFSKGMDEANKGVKDLIKNFNETDKSAKKLMATIKSRFSFDLIDSKQTARMTSNLAKLSHEISSFYGLDVGMVSQKLNMALNGSTRALREFGITVDMNSPKMKKMIEDIRLSSGETEEAAKAIAMYNEILKKGQKYEGSFQSQSKTLSQAFADIYNSLNSGVFAEAGRVLSAIFVPILEKINSLLSIPWIQKLGGIAVGLTTILGVVKSLQVAVNLLTVTLGKFNAISAVSIGGLNAISMGIGSFLAGMAKNFKKWYKDLSPLKKFLFFGITPNLSSIIKRREQNFIALNNLENSIIEAFGKGNRGRMIKLFKDFKGSIPKSSTIYTFYRDFINQGLLNPPPSLGQKFKEAGRGIWKFFGFDKTATEFSSIFKKQVDQTDKNVQDVLKKWQMSMIGMDRQLVSTLQATVGMLKNKGLWNAGRHFSGRVAFPGIAADIEKMRKSLNDSYAKQLGAILSPSLFVVIGQKLGGFFKGLWKIIVVAFSGIGRLLAGAGKVLIKIFTNPWVLLITAIIAAIGLTFTLTFKKYAKDKKLVDTNYFQKSIGERWKTVWDNIARYIGWLFSGIVDFFKGMFTADYWSGVWDSIKDFFSSFSERLVNFLHGQGFKKDKDILAAQKKEILALSQEIQDTLEAGMEMIKSFTLKTRDPKKLIEIEKKNIANLQRRLAQEQKNLQKSMSDLSWSKMRIDQFNLANQIVPQSLIEAAKKEKQDVNKYMGIINTLREKIDAATANIEQARERIREAQERYNRVRMDILNGRFEDYNVYQDAITKIEEGLGTLTESKKLAKIKDKIAEFKKTFLNPIGQFWEHMNDKDKIAYYKKLTQLELERYQAEMNMLNKERETIRETNKLIMDALAKAMEFKPQGVSGVEVGTAEGYKYLTSGLGNLASIQNAMNQTQNDEKALQVKANSIAQSTKNLVSNINTKIQSLQFNQNQILLKPVN